MITHEAAMMFIVNSGSSSLKFKLFTDALKELGSGIVERIGRPRPSLRWKFGAKEGRKTYRAVPDHTRALKNVLAVLAEQGVDIGEVGTIGHRVVHGGEEFTRPTLVTPAVQKRLSKYNKLAPLHNPPNLAGIVSCRKLMPRAKNVAVFDTAFHTTMPDYAYMYALPWKYYKKYGIRKYGFHGISHRYVSEEAAKRIGKPYAKAKIVSCHLGSGSSITAVRHGRSVDTTMGFTPLEGLTMSTRCGDIDPAVPLYLIRELGMTAAEVDDLLNTRSGLLGISGFKDLRDVMAAAGHKVAGRRPKRGTGAEGRYRANLAIEMFCYDVARYIGQFAAVMGGADAVVFTAGIGEHSDYVRKRIMAMVSLPGKPKVLVVPTDEELMIARQAKALLSRKRR